jgi:hypothetical protein
MSKEKSVAVRPAKTDLATIDQQLAAESIKDQVSAGGSGPRLSINTNGRWSTPDGAELDTTISVIVVDFVSKNTWYPHPYQAGNPLPPGCFAIGKVLANMQPCPESPEPQHDMCHGCAHDQWGSSATGKGKACKNSRELAVILEEQAADLDNAEIFIISVPPTSIKFFDGFARQVERVLGGPPIKAVVDITAMPVPGTRYSTMNFENVRANSDYADHFQLREEATAMLEAIPDVSNYVSSNQKPTRAAAPAARR